MPASWLVVLGEKLCTRLAVSSAQSCWLLIPRGHSGFSMSSDTSASKSLQRVALAPCNLDHVHSWTQCFTWCSRWRWQQHKLPSPEKPSTPSDGAPSPTFAHFYQCSPHFAKWKCMLNKSTYTYSSDQPRARKTSPFFFQKWGLSILKVPFKCNCRVCIIETFSLISLPPSGSSWQVEIINESL